MSLKTGALGVLAVGVGVVVLGGMLADNRPEPGTPAPARTGNQARIVVTWGKVRDMSILHTVGGVRYPEEVARVPPWEKAISVRPGDTVTVTVFALAPLPADKVPHTCVIEYPPGHPLPGEAQSKASYPTGATCIAVIGA
jgi:hypothetical protein